jgi:hypothetical protein
MEAVAELAKALVPFRSQDDRALTDTIGVNVSRSKALVVTDDASLAQAGEYLRGYADLTKQIEDWFRDDVRRAHELHKSLTTKRKHALDAIQGEVDRLKRSLGAYVERRDAAQRRREREAEAAAKREADARAAAEAAALEKAGQPELAAAVLEEAIAAPAPVIVLPPATPKVAGVSTVESYSFEIVAEGLVPRDLCSPDPKKIRARVESLKLAAKIPGVRVFRADQVRVRA